jgi:heat shock protein HslJ
MKFVSFALIFVMACKTTSTTSFAGKSWVLYELNGKAVVADSSMHSTPMIAFVAGENKFNGSTGCNRIGGHYEFKEGSRIRFYNVITIKMACLNPMDLENRFCEVINMADNYNLNGDILTLNKARMAPLARFKRL